MGYKYIQARRRSKENQGYYRTGGKYYEYDSRERYLVDNEIARYGINDRDVLKENEDGSIDIYVQQKKPEKEQVSNWLPAPGEPFNLILRIYLAREEVFSGAWQPPVICEIF